MIQPLLLVKSQDALPCFRATVNLFPFIDICKYVYSNKCVYKEIKNKYIYIYKYKYVYMYIYTRLYSHNPCAKHSSGAIYVRINSISALCGSRMVRGWPGLQPDMETVKRRFRHHTWLLRLCYVCVSCVHTSLLRLCYVTGEGWGGGGVGWDINVRVSCVHTSLLRLCYVTGEG